jgi:hypothetical protein
MRLSKRAQQASRARADLREHVFQWMQKHELTDLETAVILADLQSASLKYALRAERHPDDPDKGADEE